MTSDKKIGTFLLEIARGKVGKIWKLGDRYALKMMIARAWPMNGPVQMSAHEVDDCIDCGVQVVRPLLRWKKRSMS